MTTKSKELIIISLGGSLVVPSEIGIDVEFLKNFKRAINKYISPASPRLRGVKFFILVGGGKTCRVYQKALLEFGANPATRDWMGINISRLNAEVIKQMFSGNVYSGIITNPTKKIKTTKDVVVGAGWKPGWSTDYISVLIAKNYGISTIINLTNVDYVYDKNPKQFKDAKPFKQIDWKSFQRIVGDKWSPGLSMPFDPRASKLAARLKLKVVLINGKKLDQLENFFNNKPFIGTVIS